MFGSIDDLSANNDGGEFEQSFKEIYRPELVLKKENLINNEGSLLDLLIKVQNNQFSIQLYSKNAPIWVLNVWHPNSTTF